MPNDDCKFDVSHCVPRMASGVRQTAASTLLCGGPGRGMCQPEGCYCMNGFSGNQCEKQIGQNNPSSITFNGAAAKLRAAAAKLGAKE